MSVQEALLTLHDYCYSNDHCDQCRFSDLREDMGFICWVNKIVDNEEFMKQAEGIK